MVWSVIPHPLNSPDLASCDFWFFDLIKQNLDDRDDSDAWYESLTKFMKSLKEDEYKTMFDKWTERMESYVSIVRKIILNIFRNYNLIKLHQKNIFLMILSLY